MLLVLLRLTEARLRRVGWRILRSTQFTTMVPEGLVRTHRQWRVVLLLSDADILEWSEDGVDLQPGGVDSIIAVGRLRGSGRPATTDDRVSVAETELLEPPLPLAELAGRMPPPARNLLRAASTGVAAELNPPHDADVLSALIAVRPELADVVARLSRRDEPVEGEEAPILAMERDAVHLALAIAGVDFDDARVWDANASGGYLDRLAYEPREDSLIGYDATRFPDGQELPGGRPDWRVFAHAGGQIRIGNVNATRLERVLGVDLIYWHLRNDSFVLVQYKKMRQNASGSWGYRPDAQLRAELERMRAVDSEPDDAGDPATWRLFPKGCFVKLVRPPEQFDPTSDRLMRGIYLPVPYLDALLASDAALGTRGGQWLGFDTVDRYITTSLFVPLLREGWIGTHGVTTRAIEELIEAAVAQRRSVILAEDASEQTGAERRGRRRRPRG